MKPGEHRAGSGGADTQNHTTPVTYPLNLIVPQGRLAVFNQYTSLCYDLRDEVEAAAFSRTIRTPETKPDDPIQLDPADYAAGHLFDALSEANNLLNLLEEFIAPDHFEGHPDELGEWLERIIHCKYELETALIGHEDDLQQAMQGQGVTA